MNTRLAPRIGGAVYVLCVMLWAFLACSQPPVPVSGRAESASKKENAMATFRAGGEIGHMRSSWPFVTLDISENAICLSMILRKAVIKREHVTKVVCKKGPFSSAIIILHNDPSNKENLEFWTASPEKVMAEVRARGYPCE
jgi:hypothetical protein